MTTLLLEAFTILFVTIGPIDTSAVYAVLTKDCAPAERRRIALKAVLIGGTLLFIAGLFGTKILDMLGIQLSTLQIAGGILLLLVAIQMVMSEETVEHKELHELESDLQSQNHNHGDFAVFPLAVPFIAGPDVIVAFVLILDLASGNLLAQTAIFGVAAAVLAITYVSFLLAESIAKRLGKEGMELINRLLGVMLCALAVQFIIDGLSKSVLFAAS